MVLKNQVSLTKKHNYWPEKIAQWDNSWGLAGAEKCSVSKRLASMGLNLLGSVFLRKVPSRAG